jgi:hypothetical protein
MLLWKTLGGGRWRLMHYMIMDSELKYNYELKKFLQLTFIYDLHQTFMCKLEYNLWRQM